VSDQTILEALATVLPAGTTIVSQSVFIRQGIGPDTASWPALTLNIPVSDDDEFVLGPTYQTVHTCHALYLDRWESGTRTYEQIMADAAAQLTIMRNNLRGNPTLTVNGTPHCWEIRRVQRRMVGPLDKGQLGFPAIQAEMVIMVADFPETFD
jgi:hypothetical protein